MGEGWATPPNATGRSHHVDQRMAREVAAKDRARSFLGNRTKHLPKLSTLRPRCRSRSTRVAVGDRVATPPDARAQGQHAKAPGPRTRPRGSPPPPRYDGPGASRVRRAPSASDPTRVPQDLDRAAPHPSPVVDRPDAAPVAGSPDRRVATVLDHAPVARLLAVVEASLGSRGHGRPPRGQTAGCNGQGRHYSRQRCRLNKYNGLSGSERPKSVNQRSVAEVRLTSPLRVQRGAGRLLTSAHANG